MAEKKVPTQTVSFSLSERHIQYLEKVMAKSTLEKSGDASFDKERLVVKRIIALTYYVYRAVADVDGKLEVTYSSPTGVYQGNTQTKVMALSTLSDVRDDDTAVLKSYRLSKYDMACLQNICKLIKQDDISMALRVALQFGVRFLCEHGMAGVKHMYLVVESGPKIPFAVPSKLARFMDDFMYKPS